MAKTQIAQRETFSDKLLVAYAPHTAHPQPKFEVTSIKSVRMMMRLWEDGEKELDEFMASDRTELPCYTDQQKLLWTLCKFSEYKEDSNESK